MADTGSRPFAVVTGASSGIGFELAQIAARNGYDLLIAADRSLASAEECLRGLGAEVESVEVDLSTIEGVDRLVERAGGRPVDVLFANAGHGLRGAFLDQDFTDARHVVDTNITGTIYLIHKVGLEMRQRNEGRILIVGSIAGYVPGSFQLIYNATKAFIDSFAWGLREELKGSNVTITLLMPGATETEFFERAHLEDTKIGSMKKDEPAAVAQAGFDALMKGKADVVYGLKNKLQSSMANVMPASVTAAMHRWQAEPGTAYNQGMSPAMMGAIAVGGAALAFVALGALSGRSTGGARSHEGHAQRTIRPWAPAAGSPPGH